MVNEGVKARFGTKEKNNLPVAKKGLKTQSGAIRMTKADYQSMFEEKGMQNQAMSRFLLTGTSQANLATKINIGGLAKQEQSSRTFKEATNFVPMNIPEKHKPSSKLVIKAPGKMSELLMPDKPLAGGQIYSSIIGKKIEQKRALTKEQELTTKSVPVALQEATSFNSEILRSRFAAEIPAGEKKISRPPAVKPVKSEKVLLPMEKYLLEDTAIFGGKHKFQVTKPRDRKMTQVSKAKLEPLNVNIFENTS